MTTLKFRRRRSNLTDTSFEFISPAADLRRLKTIEPRTHRLHQHKTRCIATADTIKTEPSLIHILRTPQEKIAGNPC